MADLFTKTLHETKFIYFTDKIIFCPPELGRGAEVRPERPLSRVLGLSQHGECDCVVGSAPGFGNNQFLAALSK